MVGISHSPSGTYCDWVENVNWLTWALLSALFAGLTAILAKIGVTGVNSNLATAVRTTVVLVFAWGVALATTPLAAVAELPRRTWMFLALSGVATGLSWLCYFHALQLGPASRVAPIDKLSVVFVLIFAATFLGEPLTWKMLAGGALIAGGAVLLSLK
jgi:transporter family protein